MPNNLFNNINTSSEVNGAMVLHFQSLIHQTKVKIKNRRSILDKNNASKEDRDAMERHFQSLVKSTHTKIQHRLDIMALSNIK